MAEDLLMLAKRLHSREEEVEHYSRLMCKCPKRHPSGGCCSEAGHCSIIKQHEQAMATAQLGKLTIANHVLYNLRKVVTGLATEAELPKRIKELAELELDMYGTVMVETRQLMCAHGMAEECKQLLKRNK